PTSRRARFGMVATVGRYRRRPARVSVNRRRVTRNPLCLRAAPPNTTACPKHTTTKRCTKETAWRIPFSESLHATHQRNTLVRRRFAPARRLRSQIFYELGGTRTSLRESRRALPPVLTRALPKSQARLP